MLPILCIVLSLADPKYQLHNGILHAFKGLTLKFRSTELILYNFKIYAFTAKQLTHLQSEKSPIRLKGLNRLFESRERSIMISRIVLYSFTCAPEKKSPGIYSPTKIANSIKGVVIKSMFLASLSIESNRSLAQLSGVFLLAVFHSTSWHL